MKLLEVEPNFIMGQSGTLMTILQHLESKMGKGTKVPIVAISNLMRNVGYNLTYDEFKTMFDSDPNIQKLVSNFNQDEITIGPSAEDELADQGASQEGGAATVDQMAQTAAQNNIAK
jgi:hypothetical protein